MKSVGVSVRGTFFLILLVFCASLAFAAVPADPCTDGLDNDNDGLVDGNDLGCSLGADESSDGAGASTFYAYNWDNGGASLVYPVLQTKTQWLTGGVIETVDESIDRYVTELRDSTLDKKGVLLWTGFRSPYNNFESLRADQSDSEFHLFRNTGDTYVDPVTGVEYNTLKRQAEAQRINDITTRIVERLNEENIEIDAFILDTEKSLSNWAIGSGPTNTEHQAKWRAIEADPFTQQFLPDLIDLGFGPSDSIYDTVYNWRNGQNYLRWNAVMRPYVADNLNQGFYEPIQRLYPSASLSDYWFNYQSSQHRIVDHNGHENWRFGTGAHVGTHQNIVTYGGVTSNQASKLNSYGYTMDTSVFSALVSDVNKVRGARLSSDVPITQWITREDYVNLYTSLGSYDGTGLWAEMLFHSALTGIDYFLLWNQGDSVNKLNALLEELNYVTKGSKDTQITDLIHGIPICRNNIVHTQLFAHTN